MFHNQKFGIRLARLGLRPHERQKGFSDDNVGFNAAFFEFDTVMETPRRARPSIGKGENGPFVILRDFVEQLGGRGLGRAVLEQIIDVIGGPINAHIRAHAFE
jgi:hypothetical protein